MGDVHDSTTAVTDSCIHTALLYGSWPLFIQSTNVSCILIGAPRAALTNSCTSYMLTPSRINYISYLHNIGICQTNGCVIVSF